MNDDRIASLAGHPAPLARHYQRFHVAERILLTGHSHQAWPDVAFEAQQQAWLDAAEHVDEKWPRAFAVADEVGRGYARLLDDPDGDYALAPNTHELLVRWLSALPLGRRPVLVTTSGEFHSIRRQLDRLAEERLEVVKVPAEPVADLAARLAARVDGRTAAVLVSAVLFQSGRIVRGLAQVMEACARVGAELLVDAYHAVNITTFSVRAEGLAGAYVTGAGYKYCQFGEGCGFLRLPPDCRLRPAITGWFAEFADLQEMDAGGEGARTGAAVAEGPGDAGAAAGSSDRAARVRYGRGAARFAGATYEPVSHYRAAAVLRFFAEQGLDPTALRVISQHQVGRLASGFDALDLDPRVITRNRDVPLDGLGGFLVLTAPRAADICSALRARGVWTDHRGPALRLGPAPYLSDRQLDDGLSVLADVVRRDLS
ncbi:MAG: kynureninase [Candidatus Krumholzibacteriia bacterium]